MDKPNLVKAATVEIASAQGLILAPQGFLSRLDGELRRAQRYGRPLSLMLMHIDTTPEQGHPLDAQIEEIVQLSFRGKLRGSDYVGRCDDGGYAFLLTETPIKRACEVAVRVIETVREMPVSDDTPRLLASIGIAAMTPRLTASDALIQAATTELCRARQRGGDCIAAAISASVQPTVANNGIIH